MNRLSTALVAALIATAPVSGADQFTAVFSNNDDNLRLIYMVASCSDNPECQVAILSCDSHSLSLDLIGLSDEDAGNLLKYGSGVRVKSGKQSADLLPTYFGFDELNGGWDVSFASWRSANSEETSELVEEMTRSPLELVEVAKSVDFDLPTGEANLAQQIKFAVACTALQ